MQSEQKFFMTMIFGISAIFLFYSHNVSAAETTIYKCTCSNGQVVFQDLICPPNAKIELIKLPMNQSADNPAAGLREHEKQMLAQAQEGARLDKEHNHNLQIAKLQHTTEIAEYNSKIAANLARFRHNSHTHIHMYPNVAQNMPTNINQNQIALTYSKIIK